MIDFKNIKIVKKYTYEGFDYYLLDRPESVFVNAREKAKEDPEKLMLLLWQETVCDENGELLKQKKEEVIEVPITLRADICKNIGAMVTGEKKS